MIKVLGVRMSAMLTFLWSLSFIINLNWTVSIVWPVVNGGRNYGRWICSHYLLRIWIRFRRWELLLFENWLLLLKDLIISCTMRCSRVIPQAYQSPTHKILWLSSCLIWLRSFRTLFCSKLITTVSWICLSELSTPLNGFSKIFIAEMWLLLSIRLIYLLLV